MLEPLVVAALLSAGPAPAARVQLLRDDATAAYRAKRFDQACRLFAEAAKLAPDDAALAADLGLCLHRLGRADAAVAETRRAVRLAGPETERDDSKIRRSAHFNLGLFGAALPLPSEGRCAPLPSPAGCGRPLHACTYGFSSAGSGYATTGKVISVARTADGARVEEADGGQLSYGSLDEAEGPLDPATDPVRRAERALLYRSEVEEMFVGRCYEFALRACAEDEVAGKKAAACVKAKGCSADPWTCEGWDECLDASCPDAVKKRVEAAEADCSAQAKATVEVDCDLVTADACAGVVATVCTDAKSKPPKRLVHEIVLEPAP